MAAKQGPNVLICMPNRTSCILCMAAKQGPNALFSGQVHPVGFSDGTAMPRTLRLLKSRPGGMTFMHGMWRPLRQR
jgi:hypothetical protein